MCPEHCNDVGPNGNLNENQFLGNLGRGWESVRAVAGRTLTFCTGFAHFDK